MRFMRSSSDVIENKAVIRSMKSTLVEVEVKVEVKTAVE